MSVLCFGILVNASSQVISENLMRAEALVKAGRAGDAINSLDIAIAANKDFRLFLKRAEINIIRGDLTSAINDLNEANKLSEFSGEYALAKVYALIGDIQTSLYHLDQNLGSGIKVSEKEINLDPAFNALTKRPEWKSFWSRERYTSLERKISEIEFYTSAGKNDDALELLKEIRIEYPSSDEIFYADALVAVTASKFDVAVKDLIQLTSKFPDNIRYLKLLARAQEGSSNAAGATVTYSKIIESGTPDAGYLLLRAAAYRKTGEGDKALADVNKYLEMYPDDSQAMSFSGKLYATSGDNLKAIEIFNRNLQLHPQDANLYIDRANSYFSARSWEKASNDYSMALDLNPGNPDAWLNKGLALINSGKTAEGCHDLRKALSLGNNKASELISRNCIK
ncbi:MAG TPA: tetratricopeptide repeat protein [Bacteroidales bacterium]|nr:tetratricopeptide repeat protein [Bacteroidales bacterium]